MAELESNGGAEYDHLGSFLRALRDRLQPADLGLPAGVRRRAPGLRREEVAALCGISPTWYTWIEQGRSTEVSVETLNALALGLRLSRAERAYLFELAARADPMAPQDCATDPRQFIDLVTAIATPAYVLDRYWNAIAWNLAAADLFEAWLTTPSDMPRNLLRYVFLHPDAPHLIADWETRARRLVAEFRADSAVWNDDPLRLALLADLSRESLSFAAAWRSQQVLAREGGLRRFQHARHGHCAYRQYTLHVAQHAGLKLIVLLPGDGE